MSSFSDLLNHNQRLVILKALEESPAYQSNDSMLHTVLETYGHHISRDLVKTHMNWLAEQGLVTIEKVGKTLVTTATTRGVDVALGRSTVPGVKRPLPG